ncbi:MAG: DUF5119 domain-containing protein [Coprobacter sp.]|nr:DUF5119 domain-containing protein [Coprobacter sp.]
MMRKSAWQAFVSHTILLLGMVGVLLSCEHRPLLDPYNVHYIRVYIDEQIKNVTYGFYDESRNRPTYERPRILRIVLTEPVTGNIVTERYLQSTGEDERGYYIDGYIAAKEGEYNLMVYNFDTEKTFVRNDRQFYDMTAYTSSVSNGYYQYFPTVSSQLAEPEIRYIPDHFFLVSCQPIEIQKNVAIDTLRTNEGDFFTAAPLTLSYYLQIRIKGLEYVSSAVSLLSGMAGSATLYDRRMVADDAVSLFFTMEYTDVKRSRDADCSSAVLYTTFNTFGKLPDEPTIYTLNLEFMRTDGTTQVETIDITSMFDTPLVRDERWILLEHEIEIAPPLDGGGMTPDVEEWSDVWSDIQI